MRGDANRVGAKSLEERKLKIPTTTNNTLELLSQRGNACSASPELDTSMRPTRPYTRSTPAAHLQNSIPLYASYTSLHPQHACIASPELHTSTRPTPAAHLQSFRAPYLFTSHTSLHPQHASRSLASTRLQRISRPLEAKRQHTCGESPDLQGS